MAGIRKPLTRETYDSLLIAFRECPGNISFASRRALCSRQLAKRLWNGRVYRNALGTFEPISMVIERENMQALARARELSRQEAQAKEAEKAKASAEAIEALAQERQILKVARSDVLSALVLSNGLALAMKECVRAITKQLEAQADGSPPVISLKEAINLLTRHTQMTARAVGAAEAVIQLSRLDRGASTANLAIARAEDLTLDQALEELEAVEEVLSSARGGPKGLLPAPIAAVGARTRGPKRDLIASSDD